MSGLSATFLISYLLGSVSFAILVSRLRGLSDPRSYGSGNPGATNMLRTGDKRAAALTLIGHHGLSCPFASRRGLRGRGQ
jgi:glycerol-3-phosphate acyltransferase PlsY